MARLLAVTLAVIALPASARAAPFSVLHSFGGFSDGLGPSGNLLLIGSTLYGTTFGGSDFSNVAGMVFGINTNGSGYHQVHGFGFGEHASTPRTGLVYDGVRMYGTTATADDASFGTVYAVKPDGTGFQVLHGFSGTGSDGRVPSGELALIGPVLSGTTEGGGLLNGGTVFRVATDASFYNVPKNFANFPPEPVGPYAGVTLAGATLYGLTGGGGTYGQGTVFSMNTAGGVFTVLHSFGAVGDGQLPLYGRVTVVGNTLFGTTSLGGTAGQGVVFRMNTDGTGY